MYPYGFLSLSMRLWLPFESVFVCQLEKWKQKMFPLCMCSHCMQHEWLKNISYSCWAFSQYHKSNAVTNFGEEICHFLFCSCIRWPQKVHKPLSARLCSVANPTPSYRWDIYFLKTAVRSPFYWPTFKVVDQWFKEQAFLKNRAVAEVGAVGGCGIAYLCVCTRSSLSPLRLYAAFVFTERT